MGGVPVTVLVITMGFTLLGGLASGLLQQYEPFLVLGLMLLIGLPHGATDHGLFLALFTGPPRDRPFSFYFLYALVIAGYGLLWYLFPLLAFVLFILLSVYHFGQSNWADVSYSHAGLARCHYVLWGSGILLVPILLHAREAALIVAEMTGSLLPSPGTSSVLLFLAFLAGANLLVLLVCWWKSVIEGPRLIKEIIAYGLLMGMFFTNSLLLGFTVYFVFWHSLASARDQLHFFRHRLSAGVRRQLYLGILTTVGGALAFCLLIWFGPGPGAALSPGVIGGVFVFISLLTLPHMLLVEVLYSRWSPVTERVKGTGTDPESSKKVFHHRQDGSSSTSGLTIY